MNELEVANERLTALMCDEPRMAEAVCILLACLARVDHTPAASVCDALEELQRAAALLRTALAPQH